MWRPLAGAEQRGAPFQIGEVGAGQVGRAAEQLRQRPARTPRCASCEALRVATRLALSHCAAAISPAAMRRRNRPAVRRRGGAANSAAELGIGGAVGRRSARSQSACAPRRSRRASQPRADVVGNLERRMRSSPSALRVAAISSAPSASPCAFAVPARVRRALADDASAADQGRPCRGRACASTIAPSIASTSWPSTSRDHAASRRRAKRAGVSSVNQPSTSPSIEMPLSS